MNSRDGPKYLHVKVWGMGKAEASVDELVSMIERGQLRLPEMQRRYVWRASRVRDLFDSLYRGYPSGTILRWETDEPIPEQDFAVAQARNPYTTTRLLLDGQQRLTSLAAVLRGEPLTVRGRKRPIALLFNLEHPEDAGLVTEVEEDGDAATARQTRTRIFSTIPTQMSLTRISLIPTQVKMSYNDALKKMTFVVSTNKLASQPNWIDVSNVFQTDQDAPFLAKAGIERIDDPRYAKYSSRLAKLRVIRDGHIPHGCIGTATLVRRSHEIFVRVNSLGAKLRGSDLALAQITAKWRISSFNLRGGAGTIRFRRI